MLGSNLPGIGLMTDKKVEEEGILDPGSLQLFLMSLCLQKPINKLFLSIYRQPIMIP